MPGCAHNPWMIIWIRTLIAAGALAFAWADLPAEAGGLTQEMRDVLFPGAERLEDFAGPPPAARAFKDGRMAGFVLSTNEVVGSTGYGGGPIDVLVGVTLDGTITGAHLLSHNEPILVIGVSDSDLQKFVQGFSGINVLAPAVRRKDRGRSAADAIAGASVSSAVIEDAIIRAARAVLRAHGNPARDAALKRRAYAPATWAGLLAEVAIQHRRLTFGDVSQRIALNGRPDDLFIDLYTALLTPARIGGNLIGERDHQQLFSTLGAEDNAVLIAANGSYSFKGRSYLKTGVFDRIQIVQGGHTIRLFRDAYQNMERLKADGAPEFREIARFIIPAATGFDPTKPWRVELFARAKGESTQIRDDVFSFDYRLPDAFIDKVSRGTAIATADAAVPLWQEIWADRQGTVTGVLMLLGLLTTVLVFQDQLVRYRRFRDAGRLVFLGVVLVWLGWYAGGQLSVLQVLTFGHAFLTGFQWEHFLVDPVIFILWGFVAVTLLLWGRGVYCGWLCPFGALQELINAGARRLTIPQIQIPFAVHERLWAIKYVIFIGLFAVSLHSIREAILIAEVEPFKTAISLKFVRAWPFVVYVGGVLLVGLFVERFFCRYLCPLGAALAIPARLRTFNWLKRRHQCGRECQICSERCTVQAIHPTGEINPNECIHCLECQTYFFDDHICPPLVADRKRRERRQALANGMNITEEMGRDG